MKLIQVSDVMFKNGNNHSVTSALNTKKEVFKRICQSPEVEMVRQEGNASG